MNGTDNDLKPRILVVENDPQTREERIKQLVYWGYQPFVAEGEGTALLADAEYKAHHYRCHLAVVDMHLLDDHDPQDASGLELIERLKPTKTIIVSGSRNYQRARQAIQQKGALNYVAKAEGPEYLRDELDSHTRKLCSCWAATRVEWPTGWSAEQLARAFCDDPDVPEEQVKDILAQLFPGANQIWLDTIGNSPIPAPRPRSLILWARVDDLQPVIVKFARAEKIAKEIENYTKHVKDRLEVGSIPLLKDQVVLWDVGAIIYSIMGHHADFMDFASFYRDATVDDIRESLNSFFNLAWAIPYENKRTGQPYKNLFDLYSQTWDHQGQRWFNELRQYHQKGKVSYLIHVWKELLNNQLPDPVRWLAEQVDSGKAGNLPDLRVAVTHGDLHADNMLVDQRHRKTWVFDFERTGEGHVLQDFVELETDIITRIASIEENDNNSVYQLCLFACSQRQLGEKSGAQITTSVLNKTFYTLYYLRETAYTLTRATDGRQYLWGMLFNALFRAKLLIEENLAGSESMRAMLLASVICYRLEHWGATWPPKDWKHEISKEQPGTSTEHNDSPQSKVLDTARRALAILEQQAAGYTSLTRPAHLQIELEDKRREVEGLERLVAQLTNNFEPGQPRSENVSANAHEHLRKVLLECGPFENDRQLHAVFSHPDLQPWQNNLPQANSIDERVDLLIAYLLRQRHRNGQSALVIFLTVLSDRIDPATACHHRLRSLAEEIGRTLGTDNSTD